MKNSVNYSLKVPYYEKHVFSGLYIYKLVLPEPSNPQNEEIKKVLHGLCSPPTGNTALLQAVTQQQESLSQADLLCTVIGDISGGMFIPEVKFGVSSGKLAVFRNVIAQN